MIQHAVLKVGDIKEIVVKSSGLSGAQKTRHVISFVMQDESASITVTVWGDLVTKYEQMIQVRDTFPFWRQYFNQNLTSRDPGRKCRFC